MQSVGKRSKDLVLLLLEVFLIRLHYMEGSPRLPTRMMDAASPTAKRSQTWQTWATTGKH